MKNQFSNQFYSHAMQINILRSIHTISISVAIKALKSEEDILYSNTQN